MGVVYLIWIWAVLFGLIACAFMIVLLATKGEVEEVIVDERQIEAEGSVFLERMKQEQKERANS